MTKHAHVIMSLCLLAVVLAIAAMQLGSARAECRLLSTGEASSVSGLGGKGGTVLHKRICTSHYIQIDCTRANSHNLCSGSGSCSACNNGGSDMQMYKHCDTTTDPLQDCTTYAADNVTCGGLKPGTCHFDTPSGLWFCTVSGSVTSPCATNLAENCH